jgi:flagellar motor switch protein FliM
MAQAEAREPAISEEEVSALLEPKAGEAVRRYEFPVEQSRQTALPMLEVLAKTFAERATGSLSTLLGRDTTLAFESLDWIRVADLLAALPDPVTLPIVRLKPLPGFAAIRLDATVLLALLDGFYGGAGQPTADAHAAVAPAAQRLLNLLVRSVAGDLSAAWSPVSPLEMEQVKQEQNPRLLPLGGAQERVLALRFNMQFGSHMGPFEWLLPEAMLAPVREALSADGTKAARPKQDPWAPVLAQSLKDAKLELRAVLSEVQMSLGSLVRLTIGDIIPIASPQEATLMAGDVPLRRGRFGISQGRNAVKIITGGSST